MNTRELRDLTPEELRQQFETAKSGLFKARMQKVVGQAEKPVRIRWLRREIARIATIMRERGIAAGGKAQA